MVRGRGNDHRPGMGCAECLHPLDDPGTAPIPTAAFVSYWAGLLLATYFLRHVTRKPVAPTEQQIYLTPFRAENSVRSAVPRRAGCPSCSIMPQSACIRLKLSLNGTLR